MKIRPCIDIHQGKVKQIVGSTLKDDVTERPCENFVSTLPSSWYADLFRKDGLTGGHVIMLGAGCEEEAGAALASWPGGFQIGGGITASNARHWLDIGASHVIVTSFVFQDGLFRQDRMDALLKEVGRQRIVLDLSCRKKDGKYYVVTDRWQKFTELAVTDETLSRFSLFADEFLVHGVDVEGKKMGVDLELVGLLASFSPIVTTYAGGVSSMQDVKSVQEKGLNRLDLTVGSALDIFGGKGVRYEELVAFQRVC